MLITHLTANNPKELAIMEKEIVIKSLDGVCLVDLKYISPEGFQDLIRCQPGSIIRVKDVDKAVRFIDYPEALKNQKVDG